MYHGIIKIQAEGVKPLHNSKTDRQWWLQNLEDLKMGKYNAQQIIQILVDATDDIADKWVTWGKEHICDEIVLDYVYDKDNNIVFTITITDWAKYYPSHSYYDPDEYEYGDYFIGDDDTEYILNDYIGDFVKDMNISTLTVKKVDIGDINGIEEDYYD